MKNEQKRSLVGMQRMHGKVAMSVYYRDGKTDLGQLFQEGAAKMHFPQNDKVCFEGVMINTAGGITGGDHLEWDIRLHRKTEVILTTQAAEKIYRTIDKATPAKVDIYLSIAEKSRLCWLPQETIIFNCSALQRKLNVSMVNDSEFLLSEAIVFGRKLMGEHIKQAFLKENWIIRRDTKIIHAEALHLGPDIAKDIAMPIFLNGGGAMASLLLISRNSEQFSEQAHAIVDDVGGVSSWNGKLFARIVCRDFYLLRKKLVMLLSLLNYKTGIPKMWSI